MTVMACWRWKSFGFLMSVGLLLATPSNAHACGVCVFGLFGWYVPGAGAIAPIAFCWFVASAVLLSSWAEKGPGIPGISGTLATVFLALLSTAFLGPLIPFALGVPALLTWVLALCRLGPGRSWPGRLRAVVTAAGAFALVLAIAFVLRDVRWRLQATEADYILRWEAAGISREHLKLLRQGEPGSIVEYRKLLLRARWAYNISDVADRISVIGEPDVDVPLLIRALERPESAGHARERIVLAIENFSDISLPATATASEWQRAWEDGRRIGHE